MKLKKTILGLAVVAVAGVNAWLANDTNTLDFSKSLTLENIADASTHKETVDGSPVTIEQNGECVTVIEYFSSSEAPNGGIRKVTYCDGMTGEKCVLTAGKNNTPVAEGYGNRF